MRTLIIITLLIIGTGCTSGPKLPQYTKEQCAELKAKHSTPQMRVAIPACVALGLDAYE